MSTFRYQLRSRLLLWSGITLAILSLALWIASLWIISYRTPPALGKKKPQDFTLMLARGEVQLNTVGTYASPGFDVLLPSPAISRIQWWPDHFFKIHRLSTGFAGISLNFPLWIPCLTGIALVALHRRIFAAHRSITINETCTKCSYPRAGLQPQTPCPECGHA